MSAYLFFLLLVGKVLMLLVIVEWIVLCSFLNSITSPEPSLPGSTGPNFRYCLSRSLAGTSVIPHSMASRMASWRKMYWGCEKNHTAVKRIWVTLFYWLQLSTRYTHPWKGLIYLCLDHVAPPSPHWFNESEYIHTIFHLDLFKLTKEGNESAGSSNTGTAMDYNGTGIGWIGRGYFPNKVEQRRRIFRNTMVRPHSIVILVYNSLFFWVLSS